MSSPGGRMITIFELPGGMPWKGGNTGLRRAISI
jgi:hypothetical protein